jgi:hypothetical protein
MPSTLVPDEVWEHLDPLQARLGKQSRRALALAVALVVATILGIALGVASGELRGNLYVPTWSIHVDTRTHSFNESVAIQNNGWFDETINGVGFNSPGLRATDLRPIRLTVPHGHTRTLRFTVTVSDCTAVRPGESDPVVKLERFWGTQSVELQVLDWTNGLQPGSDALANGPGWAACNRGG